MARLTPEYSANRVVRQYAEVHYIPAARAYKARADQGGKLGGELLEWQQKLAVNWNRIAFGALRAESKNDMLNFEVPVYLGGLDPDAVRVELFANGTNGQGPLLKPMSRGVQLPGDGFVYTASVAATRPAGDFTPRVIPYHPNASVPVEASQILWQK